jgi:hypothetical protein
MRQGPLARLRALVLLVAFGIGLAGQAVASPLMPMAQNDTPWLTVPMGGSGSCPGCDRNDSSPAPVSGCAVAFCSVSPAILPQGPTVKPPLTQPSQPPPARGFRASPSAPISGLPDPTDTLERGPLLSGRVHVDL